MSPKVIDTPTKSADFSDPEFLRDPFPALDEFRELAPAVYNPALDMWVICGYGHIRKAFAQTKKFPQNAELMRSLWGADSMNAIDNPQHDIVRGIWSRHMLREPLEQRRRFIEDLVDRLLTDLTERLRSGETVDVVPNLVRPIPALAVGNLLGLPPEDSGRWIAMAHGIGEILSARPDNSPESQRLLQEGTAWLNALLEYLDEQMAQRRRTGSTDDLIGVMANSGVDIPHEEQRANIVQMVFAGHDTAEKAMATAIATFVEYPDVHAQIKADRSLLPQAIEELLRWQAPVFTVPRVVQGDIEFEGISMSDGDVCGLVTGAANRDPDRWDRPGEFDIHRKQSQSMTFGFGIHSCIGINLARLELGIICNKFLDAVPDYHVDADQLHYGTNYTLRGPVSVPIAL